MSSVFTRNFEPGENKDWLHTNFKEFQDTLILLAGIADFAMTFYTNALTVQTFKISQNKS